MPVNDPVGDMLTRIRNAQLRGRSSVHSPASKLRGWVLDVLKDEGFIRDYELVTGEDGRHHLEIALKYHDGTPVIRELRRVSRPGRRGYSGARELPLVRQGLGIAIVSTSKGVMSDMKARSANVGGEIICTVF